MSTAQNPTPSTPTALLMARAFVARGWRPFPLDHPRLPRCAGSGRRCRENRERHGDCKAKDRGKHPVNVWSTQTASPPTDGMLTLWFGGSQPRNVGIAAGPSGLLIIDEDELDALTTLANKLGEALPVTYRVMTARGWHWYFADPDNEFGNGAGALADYGCDVRGGHGDGGYVVAASSLHRTGVEYVAEDSAADVAPVPEWIKKLLRTPAVGATTGDDPPRPPREGPWNDDPRYAFSAELLDQYRRHLAGLNALAPPEGGKPNGEAFRHALFVAARDGWRLVDSGLIDEVTMHNELRDGIRAVWHADPDDDDRQIIYTEARDKATASPWVITDAQPLDPPPPASDPTGAGSGTSGGEDRSSDPGPGKSSGGTADDRADALERELQAQVERDYRRRALAKRKVDRELAAEARAHRVRIADGLVDDLDSIESPEMLMDSLIPEDSIGFLAGRSGAYKSFLATAWACCIATGRPWLGDSRFTVRRPLRVLYVAAEGAAGAAGRIRAWERASGVSRRGRLTLYPRPIHLNDPAQVEELIAVVVEHGFEFVVIDTYHRSAPGTEENSSTDFGTVYEVVAGLRDDHGCSSLFVDHTGNSKTGNPRGTSAKRDDADYILSTSYLGEEAVGEAQRELFVTKLKDEDTSGRWPLRLAEVEGEHFPVVEIGEVGGSSVIRNLGEWWVPATVRPIPDEVVKAIEDVARKEKQRGRGVEQAKWIWRLLAANDDENGMTRTEIKRLLGQALPTAAFSEELIKRGAALLTKTRFADCPTRSTIMLNPDLGVAS